MTKKSVKSLYLDVSSSVLDRHLSSLLFFFSINGYHVYIKPTIRTLVSFSRNKYTKMLLDIKHISVRCIKPKSVDIFISDRKRRGALRISADYFSKADTHSFHVPIAMHPLMYRDGYYTASRDLARRTDRRIKIFFAGNFDSNAYRNDYIKTLFGTLTRLELYDLLISRLNDDVYLPENRESLFYSNDRDIVLIDTKTRFKIPMGEFLSVLADAHFFVAFPGVHKPLCHNLVEAMSVGCIPILEYGGMFDPPLSHGLNCLSFKGGEQFVSVMEKALHMDSDTILSMRRAVIDYYHRFFSPSAVVQCIEKRLPELRTLYINAGSTVPRLRKRG
jgi:hypothetical protein